MTALRGSPARRPESTTALARAAAFLRLPDSKGDPVEVEGDGRALRCPRTGRVFRVEGGVLDLLGPDFEKTPVQKPLDVPSIAWLYDLLRPHMGWTFAMPSFATEVEQMVRRLDLAKGDVVVDVACGHGNFTLEIARAVGEEGLVIGVDIAGAMLRRAAARMERAGIGNVLLVRGDAQALPIADAAVSKINCAGGLHGIPDLRRALSEFARASAEGARFTGSGFALAPQDRMRRFKQRAKERWDMSFVDMQWVADELSALGYAETGCDLPSSWFGQVWAAGAVGGPG